MYVTVQEKSVYIRLLQKENTCMYANVRQNPMYMCQNIAKIRRRIRNSYSKWTEVVKQLDLDTIPPTKASPPLAVPLVE